MRTQSPGICFFGSCNACSKVLSRVAAELYNGLSTSSLRFPAEDYACTKQGCCCIERKISTVKTKFSSTTNKIAVSRRCGSGGNFIGGTVRTGGTGGAILFESFLQLSHSRQLSTRTPTPTLSPVLNFYMVADGCYHTTYDLVTERQGTTALYHSLRT